MVGQLVITLALLLEIIRNNDQSHDYKRELVRFDFQIRQNLAILYNCCLKHNRACQIVVLTITGTIFLSHWALGTDPEFSMGAPTRGGLHDKILSKFPKTANSYHPVQMNPETIIYFYLLKNYLQTLFISKICVVEPDLA